MASADMATRLIPHYDKEQHMGGGGGGGGGGGVEPWI